MTHEKARAECIRQAEANLGIQFYVIPNGKRFQVVSFDELMAIKEDIRPVYAYFIDNIEMSRWGGPQ